jgi:hypothetical protein
MSTVSRPELVGRVLPKTREGFDGMFSSLHDLLSRLPKAANMDHEGLRKQLTGDRNPIPWMIERLLDSVERFFGRETLRRCLDAFLSRWQMAAVDIEPSPAATKPIVEEVADVAFSVADVVSDTRDAIASGAITPTRLRIIDRNGDRAVREIRELQAAARRAVAR